MDRPPKRATIKQMPVSATSHVLVTDACENGRQGLAKWRMHGCGKDHERRSHCNSEEILKGHKMSPRLRLTMTPARNIAVTIPTVL
jgi:hypothetical protein